MTRVPIVREVAWFAVLPQLAVIFACMALVAAARGGYDDRVPLFGAGGYCALSLVLRYTISREHRIGVRLMRAQRFEDALPHFEKSAAFFGRHPRVDRFRAFTLLSASRMSYREMALCNIAFGLSQMGRGSDARAAYDRVLREYPDNSLANAAMNMISAAESAGPSRAG
jgi:tetratricopeptide (TPR) repeat protein